MMCALNLCTFAVTGDFKISQYFLICQTCSASENSQVGVCLNCAAICHEHHDLGRLVKDSFTCGCAHLSNGCKALHLLDPVPAAKGSGDKKRKLLDGGSAGTSKSDKFLAWTQYGNESKQVISAHYSPEDANEAAKKAFVANNPWEWTEDQMRSLGHATQQQFGGGLRLRAEDGSSEVWLAGADPLDAFFDSCAAPAPAPIARARTDDDLVIFKDPPVEVKKPKEKKEKAEKKEKVEKAVKPRGKQVKEAGQPKGPSASFMFYSSASRERIVANNPGLSVTDISRVIGTEWKGLSAEEKAPFEEMSRADRLRYAREMEDFRKRKEEGSPPPTPSAGMGAATSSMAQIMAAARFAAPMPTFSHKDDDAPGAAEEDGGDGDVEDEGSGMSMTDI